MYSSSSSRPTLQLLPHRLAHLLFHDLSFVSNCLLIVLRVFTLSRFVSSFLTLQANLISQDVTYVKLLGRKPLFKPFPINLLLSLPRCLSLRCFFLSSTFLFGPSSLLLVMPASSSRLRLPAAAVLLLKSAGQLQGLDSLDGYHLHATLYAIVLLHILHNEVFQVRLGILQLAPRSTSVSRPQGYFRQPTWRPSCISCMHQFYDSSACSTTCCS